MQVDPTGSSGAGPTSVSGVEPVSEMSPPPSTYLSGTLDGISSSLGLSTDALRGDLRSGSSLAQVAQQQGVSRSDMLQTIESQMQHRRADRGLAPLDATAVDRIANRAIDRSRGGSSSSTPSPDDPGTTLATATPPEGSSTDGVDIWA
jgi:hypothetical protein